MYQYYKILLASEKVAILILQTGQRINVFINQIKQNALGGG